VAQPLPVVVLVPVLVPVLEPLPVPLPLPVDVAGSYLALHAPALHAPITHIAAQTALMDRRIGPPPAR
jgi:hypothetical protein